MQPFTKYWIPANSLSKEQYELVLAADGNSFSSDWETDMEDSKLESDYGWTFHDECAKHKVEWSFVPTEPFRVLCFGVGSY